MQKNQKLAAIHSSIIHRKLGLKPKLTVDQQLNEFGVKKRPQSLFHGKDSVEETLEDV